MKKFYYGINVKKGYNYVDEGIAYTKRDAKDRVIMLKKAGFKAKMYPIKDDIVRGPIDKEVLKEFKRINKRGK